MSAYILKITKPKIKQQSRIGRSHCHEKFKRTSRQRRLYAWRHFRIQKFFVEYVSEQNLVRDVISTSNLAPTITSWQMTTWRQERMSLQHMETTKSYPI